ncbi:hypothetical protein N9B94_03400 [Verrucomicrobia bacterium]|nr:hypothetical protein [Verrucomicrobiota bacterium]
MSSSSEEQIRRARRHIEREVEFGQVREDVWSIALDKTSTEEEAKSYYIQVRVEALTEAEQEQRNFVRRRGRRRGYSDDNAPFQGIGPVSRHVVTLMIVLVLVFGGIMIFVSR